MYENGFIIFVLTTAHQAAILKPWFPNYAHTSSHSNGITHFILPALEFLIFENASQLILRKPLSIVVGSVNRAAFVSARQ